MALDERRRELQHRWLASGNCDDKADWLGAELRSGRIPQPNLQLAALCGDVASRAALADQELPVRIRLKQPKDLLFKLLHGFGRLACLEYCERGVELVSGLVDSALEEAQDLQVAKAQLNYLKSVPEQAFYEQDLWGAFRRTLSDAYRAQLSDDRSLWDDLRQHMADWALADPPPTLLPMYEFAHLPLAGPRLCHRVVSGGFQTLEELRQAGAIRAACQLRERQGSADISLVLALEALIRGIGCSAIPAAIARSLELEWNRESAALDWR